MKTNISKGKYGENLAKNYILSKGYKILELNYTTKLGEIDIIALDKDIIVCIEVKTRSNKNFGYAFEAVNFKKQRKIINTSNLYMKYKQIQNIQIRYDIIEVYLEKTIDINHIENAFCL
ncbi:MAG: YraN family protein [Tissierella sp.]|uniref:YraN family protein n=1 Tax=Tissierella sp. TaxID=41274 RepID=UPI003F976EF6